MTSRNLLICRGERPPRRETGSLTRRRHNLEPAAMLLHDLLHRRNAEAGAEILGGKQRLENLGGVLGRNSRAVVRDRKLYASRPSSSSRC